MQTINDKKWGIIASATCNYWLINWEMHMSKKSKKRQSRKKRTTSSQTPVNDATVNSEQTKTYNSGFDPDYSQTIKDLKRIGILAGTFIAFLVVLSFFLG